MPSLSEALRKAKGRLLPMGWYHLLKVLFLHKYPPMLDLLLVAVKPEYQNKGVNALLFSDLLPVYQQLGFKYADSNPALELNGKVQAPVSYTHLDVYKRQAFMLLGLEIFPLGLHLSIQFQFRITFGILESQLLIYRNQVRE